jgi:hypothetical protein
MKRQGTSKDPHGREPFPRDTPLFEVVVDTSGGIPGRSLDFHGRLSVKPIAIFKRLQFNRNVANC